MLSGERYMVGSVVFPHTVPRLQLNERALGRISSYHILGKRVIILNTFEAAGELLNKRASIYSERPVRPMVGDWNSAHGAR